MVSKFLLPVFMILSLGLGMLGSAHAGGDGPFPIRMAASRLWVSQSAHSQVAIKLDVLGNFADGSKLVGVQLMDNRTGRAIAYGEAILRKNSQQLSVRVLDQKNAVSLLRLKIRRDDETGSYEMTVNVRSDNSPGQSLIFFPKGLIAEAEDFPGRD